MADTLGADLCVIGAGAAGLTVAAGGSQLGARVILIEKGRMGGDCLNSGCVPSKALLASAQAASAIRRARQFGVDPGGLSVDFDAVRRHVRNTIEAITPNDSPERFAGLGVQVIADRARFIDPETVETERGVRVRARRFVLATGSAPALPDIPGIGGIPVLTNETVFDLPALPEHLLVLGAGPVGIELGSAFLRLGSEVTLVDAGRPLAGFDAEVADVLLGCLRREGVRLISGRSATRIDRVGDRPGATLDDGSRIGFSHLLAATGRTPAIAGLGLDVAGIAYGPEGIQVDRRLRTSNRRVYAIGDVAATGHRLTPAASHQAALVLRHALFRMPVDWTRAVIPSIVFGDPELAQAGLDEVQARERYGRVNVLRWPFAENDRAQAELRRDGLVKAVTDRKGRILGASIVGPHAAELIQPWVLALSRHLPIAAMAGLAAPYPTFGEASKRAAGSFFTRRLFSDRTRGIVRFLLRFG